MSSREPSLTPCYLSASPSRLPLEVLILKVPHLSCLSPSRLWPPLGQAQHLSIAAWPCVGHTVEGQTAESHLTRGLDDQGGEGKGKSKLPRKILYYPESNSSLAQRDTGVQTCTQHRCHVSALAYLL